MGKSTISMAIFNSYFDVYQRVMSFIHKLGVAHPTGMVAPVIQS